MIIMRPIDAAWGLLKAADFADPDLQESMGLQAGHQRVRDAFEDFDPERYSQSRWEENIPLNVAQLLADEDVRAEGSGKKGQLTHQLQGQRLNYTIPNHPYEDDEFRERMGNLQERTDVMVKPKPKPKPKLDFQGLRSLFG